MTAWTAEIAALLDAAHGHALVLIYILRRHVRREGAPAGPGSGLCQLFSPGAQRGTHHKAIQEYTWGRPTGYRSRLGGV